MDAFTTSCALISLFLWVLAFVKHRTAPGHWGAFRPVWVTRQLTPAGRTLFAMGWILNAIALIVGSTSR